MKSAVAQEKLSREHFEVDGGTALYLNASISHKVDLGRNPFGLKGNISERAEQTAQLFAQGVAVGKLDDGGFIARKDLDYAMEIMWELKPKGWYHYQQELLARRLCTPEEFTAATREY